MFKYSLTLSMNSATRTFLQKGAYTLYLFKGIDAGAGAMSTVWLTIAGTQLSDQDPNTITWYEDYYIGETSTEIKDGETIVGKNPFASSTNIQSIELGKKYVFPGTDWNLQPVDFQNNDQFAIQNTEQQVNQFYVSQKLGSDAAYIVVTQLLGSNGQGTFTPIETVALILSTKAVTTGAMVDQAFSPGAIITLSGNTGSLTYDKDKGWSASAGDLKSLASSDPVYESMRKAAQASPAVAGRYPGAPAGFANLSNNKTTTSQGTKVNGVKLKGVPNALYAPGVGVTVKAGDIVVTTQIMTTQTDVKIKFESPAVGHLTNHSGAQVQYEWVLTADLLT
jgi:hypothetical protein